MGCLTSKQGRTHRLREILAARGHLNEPGLGLWLEHQHLKVAALYLLSNVMRNRYEDNVNAEGEKSNSLSQSSFTFLWLSHKDF